MKLDIQTLLLVPWLFQKVIIRENNMVKIENVKEWEKG